MAQNLAKLNARAVSRSNIRWSNNSITAATNSAGKANSANTVATKMPHTVSGILISVMPRVLACRIVTT